MSNDSTLIALYNLIVKKITSVVPVAIDGMPYAQRHVFEEMINRLRSEDHFEVGTKKGFEFSTTYVQNSVGMGFMTHYPVLDEHAFKMTKELLSEIESTLKTSNIEMKEFILFLEDMV